MGFLGQALQGGNTIQTSPYQGQTNLANQAQNALTQQQGISGQQQNFLNALTGNAQNAASGLNTLGGQLQQEATGAGPNPALNQLNQATSQNMANTAAQIANTKGINPGLAGRLAAQQGAQTQQQAAGQAATMGAQQQLGAQNALSTLYGNQVNQAQNQQNFTGQQGLAQQQLLQQALQAQNQQNVAGQTGNVQGANAIGGGALSGITSFLLPTLSSPASSGGGGAADAALAFSHGGKVPVMLSPGELKLSPEKAQQVAQGQAKPMSAGSVVPGKASVQGDSFQNDTVRDSAEPGSIIVPRSKMNSEENAKAFVQAILNSKGSFGKVVSAKRRMEKGK